MKTLQNKEYKIIAKKLFLKKSQPEIAKSLGISLSNLEWKINKYKLQGIKKLAKEKQVKTLSFNNVYFCYFIGLFLTDGYYHPNGIIEISLKQSDEHILKLLSINLGLKINKYSNYWRIYSDLSWAKKFTEVTEITPGAKTYTANFSKFYDLNAIQQKFIIRGMIDGDGSIRKSGIIRFFSCSKYLIDMVKFYFDKLSIKYTIILNKNGMEINTSEESKMFAAINLYKLFPLISIRRKQLRIQVLIDDIVRTYEMINRKNYRIKSL